MLPAHLNLDAVQSFAVFADSLNFSHAADHLHLSQPALHTKIRKLGEQLGTALYVRKGRQLVLTPQGESLARFGRELVARTHQFCGELEGHTQPTITLAAGEGAYMYLLGGAIKSLLARTDTRLSLLLADREGALQLVREGRAALGVAPLETVPDEMEAAALTTVGQVLIVPRKHPLATRKSLRLTHLANCALIVPPEGRPHRQMLARLLQSANVPWTVAVEASGWELMIRFVQAGIGLAVVNACCTIPKDLKAIPLPDFPRLQYHLFGMRGALPSPARDHFSRMLIQHANDWQK